MKKTLEVNEKLEEENSLDALDHIFLNSSNQTIPMTRGWLPILHVLTLSQEEFFFSTMLT